MDEVQVVTAHHRTLLVTHDRSHLHRMDAVYRMVDGKVDVNRAASAV